MRAFLVIILFQSYVITIVAQDTIQDLETDSTAYMMNSVYVEFGSHGGIYSLNYDRVIFYPKSGRIGIGAKIGFSYYKFGLFNDIDTYTILPVDVYVLFGKRRRMESGVGYGFNFGTDTWPNMAFRLGYRYQKPGGLIIRIAPIILYNTYHGELAPMVTFSIGLPFK